VRKTFGTTIALENLSLAVHEGELLSVLGPNGAGKSTAIELLLGLQRPDAGVASLFGRSPPTLAERQQIGVMMQEVVLPPDLRAREHIDLASSYYASPHDVDELIVLTDIRAFSNKRYGDLSGGQKRQVQFAMAICGRPRLLFLDEPTVGLDVQARARMWSTIRALVKQGCSIVLTTHYLEEADALADRVAVIAKGKLIAEGSVHEVRSIVSRKTISCVTHLSPEILREWSGVEAATLDDGRTKLTVVDAEPVVRKLLAFDAQLEDLEIHRAGLAEAFLELTREEESP
jgi:ABC-2 type transport system ATP-binding protein